MTVFDVASGAEQVLDLGMPVEEVSFRPPNGDELMFVVSRARLSPSTPSVPMARTSALWSVRQLTSREPSGRPMAPASPTANMTWPAIGVVHPHRWSGWQRRQDPAEPAAGDLPALPGLVTRRKVGRCRPRLLVWSGECRTRVGGGLLTVRDHLRRRLGAGQGTVRLLFQLRGRLGLVAGRHQDRQRSD